MKTSSRQDVASVITSVVVTINLLSFELLIHQLVFAFPIEFPKHSLIALFYLTFLPRFILFSLVERTTALLHIFSSSMMMNLMYSLTRTTDCPLPLIDMDTWFCPFNAHIKEL